MKIEKLELEISKPNFWDDASKSTIILQELKQIKGKYTKYENIQKEIKNLKEFIDFLEIEKDEELEKELENNVKKLEKELEKFEIQILLNGKYDNNNAILTLHPGAGGTESQDWVQNHL